MSAPAPEAGVDPLSAVARSWYWVVALALVGAAALGAAASVLPPGFESRSVLLFTPGDPTQALSGSPQAVEPGRMLQSQAEVVLGDDVVGRAADEIGTTPEDVRRRLTAETADGDLLVTVVGTGDSPGEAQDLTAAVADAYAVRSTEAGVASLVEQAEALQPSVDALLAQSRVLPPPELRSAQQDAVASQLATIRARQDQLLAASRVYPGQVQVLSAAQEPEEPATPTVSRSAGVGAVLGAVLGVLVALARAWRRPRAAVPRGARHRGERAPEGDPPATT
ncbi:hypothetical protein [uncultured Pseudokineococcus sp.]|uniref:hypothetical protein n=1 Tax=uncultured Pseudokineococcus sp. TaxID=1642928 RepID=UPI0026036A9F|nr:hypothetical protein [uncultured Pseudokineococcus sp.]